MKQVLQLTPFGSVEDLKMILAGQGKFTIQTSNPAAAWGKVLHGEGQTTVERINHDEEESQMTPQWHVFQQKVPQKQRALVEK